MSIVILTQTPDKPWFSKYYWKGIVRSVVRKYRGPQVVIQSAIRGFEKLGVDYKLNPSVDEILSADCVWANESLDALAWAIKMKKSGKIKKLVAGPNLVILPSDYDSIICAPEIDRYLTVSDWTYKMYVEDRPGLASRLVIWPAGVDADAWQPSITKDNSKKVIIFEKNADTGILRECRTELVNRGYDILDVRYGKYDHEGYLRLLQSAEFLVYFNESESQGIALAEAWSANIPTIVWNNGEIVLNYNNVINKKVECSSAPYLSNSTGRFFRNIDEFKKILDNIGDIKLSFSPRQWVLNNMSDEVCAKKLLQIINF